MNLTDLLKNLQEDHRTIRLVFIIGTDDSTIYFEGTIEEINEGFFTFKYSEEFSKEPVENDVGETLQKAKRIHFFDAEMANLWRIEEL